MKLTKYRAKVQEIFNSKSSNSQEFEKDKLDFNNYMEIMWELKLYPLKISKKVLRFTYLFEKSHEYGINVENLGNLFIVLGIYCGKSQNHLASMKEAIEIITGFH